MFYVFEFMSFVHDIYFVGILRWLSSSSIWSLGLVKVKGCICVFGGFGFCK